MSIKSDRWIRRMAAEHGMIEPFSPEQVRVADGHKIVSYGTSSYGYDVRCADEFKIFTNINSTIVDPKNFDEKSFVDFKGPVCIIPPNSFALASTVEYLPDSAQRFDGLSWENASPAIPASSTPIPARMCRSRRCAGASARLAWDGSALEAGKSVGLHAAGQARGLRTAHSDGIAHSRDGQSSVSECSSGGCP